MIQLNRHTRCKCPTRNPAGQEPAMPRGSPSLGPHIVCHGSLIPGRTKNRAEGEMERVVLVVLPEGSGRFWRPADGGWSNIC